MNVDAIVECIESEDENIFSGRITKVEFFSDEDDTLCNHCRSLDGKIFDITADDLPLLPVHPHCRCKYVVPGSPGRDISHAVEKYRICRHLVAHKDISATLARELAGEVIRARKENKKIRETDWFMLFNGRYFFSSDGKFIVDAVAGQPVDKRVELLQATSYGFVRRVRKTYFDYSVKRQGEANKGGLPCGLYHAKTKESGSFWNGNVSKHGIRRISWGTYHWQLVPDEENDMRGRKKDSFTIHGGLFPQSAGCIDLTSHDGEFRDYIRSTGREKMCVYVQYARETVILEEDASRSFIFPY